MRPISLPAVVLLTGALAAGATLALLGARNDGSATLQSRPAAPAFSLRPYEGGAPRALSDYRGKVVLLYFWFPT